MTLPVRLALAVALVIVPMLPAPTSARTTTILDSDEVQFATNAAWAPDGRLFYTEKDLGEVWIVRDGKKNAEPFVTVDVVPGGEQGLLGIVLDPNFGSEPWVYLYLSDPNTELNRVIRVRADGDSSGQIEPVIDLVTVVNGYHNGGDMAFGPDGKLYLAVGEAHESETAQDPNSVGGKILRINPDGSIPADNPLGPDNPVYTLGHRNSFGLCFDRSTGQLWETENGPQEWDEVNMVEPGGNYGWPDALGPDKGAPFLDPTLAYQRIIVPTGCVARDNTLWFGDFYGNLHRYRVGDDADEVIATFPTGIVDLEFDPAGHITVVTMRGIDRFDPHDTEGVQPVPPEAPSPTPLAAPRPADTSTVSVESPVSLGIFLALILAGVAGVGVFAWRRRDDVKEDERR